MLSYIQNMNFFNIEKLKLWQGIVLGVLTISLIGSLAFAIPLGKDFNLDRYSGGQRRAAEKALELEYRKGDGKLPYFAYFLKSTVEEVAQKCVEYDSSTGNYRYIYTSGCTPQCTIKLSNWTVFGIKVDTPIYLADHLNIIC